MRRPALPSPPPPARPTPKELDDLLFYEWDVDSKEFLHIQLDLTARNIIRGVKRLFRIRPYRPFFFDSTQYTAQLDCACIIEDYDKKLFLAAQISSATLHYDELNEPVRSNWGESPEIGDKLLFSPSSVFESLRNTTSRMGWINTVHFEQLVCKMPWRHKVEKLRAHVECAMNNIHICVQRGLGLMHSGAVIQTYSERFGQYYNGYAQAMNPVIASNFMECSELSTFPEKISVNPAEFVIYTRILGETMPRMTLYKQYVRYAFANGLNVMYQHECNYVTPMYDPTFNESCFAATGGKQESIGKYRPIIKVWSYEEFCKRCDRIDAHMDDTATKDEKAIKEFINKVMAESNALGHNYALNKFPEHTR